MNKLKQSERRRFTSEAIKLIKKYGGRDVPESIYPFRLDTIVGPLGLDIDENMTVGPGTIFGRFEEIESASARKWINSNPYTGKWNHHYFGGWTVDEALADVDSWLRLITEADDGSD